MVLRTLWISGVHHNECLPMPPPNTTNNHPGKCHARCMGSGVGAAEASVLAATSSTAGRTQETLSPPKAVSTEAAVATAASFG